MKIRNPPSRRCCNSVMLGRVQASSGLPRLPMAHSHACCRHRDFSSLPAGSCRAQQGAWPGHHRARSHFSLPASSPIPSRSGQKAGAENRATALFPAAPAAAGSESWQRARTFPARRGLGTRWGSSGYSCTGTDGL